MDIKLYKLGDQVFESSYKDNISQDDCISITLTLNPLMYSADILTQYREAIKELKSSHIFYEKYKQSGVTMTMVNPYFTELVLCPELTKDMNIHFHGYLKCDPQYNKYFQNEFKKFTYKNKVFGRQHSFKLIDDLTPVLRSYPFKDTAELLKFPDSLKIYSIKFSKNNLDS